MTSLGWELSERSGRMYPSIKSRWVKALRSDKWMPMFGRPALCYIDTEQPMWNALGVLCDVMNIPWQEATLGGRRVRSYDGSTIGLSLRVLALAGLRSRGPFVDKIYIDSSLFIQAYSIQGLSTSGARWADIADYIEEQL